MRCDSKTRAHETKRTAGGKTHREIRRSVRRALARRLYRRMEAAWHATRKRRQSIGGGLTSIGASDGPPRQYFPRGTALAWWTSAGLQAGAHPLNTRPRNTDQQRAARIDGPVNAPTSPPRSFFALLQQEHAGPATVPHTGRSTPLNFVTWIERTHHRERRQRPLGKLTPIKFETVKRTAAATA